MADSGVDCVGRDGGYRPVGEREVGDGGEAGEEAYEGVPVDGAGFGVCEGEVAEVGEAESWGWRMRDSGGIACCWGDGVALFFDFVVFLFPGGGDGFFGLALHSICLLGDEELAGELLQA